MLINAWIKSSICRWTWSSLKLSLMVPETWSPSCFATTPSIASHYRVSSTTSGCVPTLTGSCLQPALSRNPEPALWWVFFLPQETVAQYFFGFTAMGFKLPLYWQLYTWKGFRVLCHAWQRWTTNSENLQMQKIFHFFCFKMTSVNQFLLFVYSRIPFFFFPPQMYSPYVCPYLCIVPSLEVCFVFGNCDFFTFQNWHSFVLDCCLRWCWHQNTTVRLPHLYSWIVCAEGFGACAGKHVLISFKMYFNFLINIVKGFVCIKWVIDHRVYI